MALNMQTSVLFGRTSAPPASQFEHLRSFRSREAHTLSAGVRARASSTSWPPLGGELATKSKVLMKIGRASQRIKCSSTDYQHHSGNDAGTPELKSKPPLVEILQKGLQNTNAALPYAIVASTMLAFLHPSSFTWFSTRYYAPALGFLMFAVGINLSAKSFLHAIERPAVLAVGYGGQYIVKPILGLLVAYIAISLLHLPSAIGTGLLLVSCVSGAQLSNYATFIVDPSMAPLSIVMTALSTITAVLVTPVLSLLLLGKKLPIDVLGMMASITQIVVVPIATGLSLNKFLPSISNLIRPFLPICSMVVTCCCIGSPLAVNIKALRSPFGLSLVLPVFIFHLLAFIIGYKLPQVLFQSEPDVQGLAKTISFETGMQSSLLALALANNFFEDPLVSLPPAISTVLMSLMGFGLSVVWHHQQKPAAQ